MIDFYTAATPNGYKVAIFLEEAGLDYTPHFVDLGAAEQKQPDFLRINPNGRIPAIVDCAVDGGFAVFESGAILLYLAEQSGRFLPSDAQARSRTIQWLMWQMGGLGPMMGQLNVFRKYFPETIPAAIERYERESYRLFDVMETQLAANAWLAGDAYTIADMAAWPWVAAHRWPGLTLDRHPALKAWHDRIRDRPAVVRAMQVPPRAVKTDDDAAKFVEKARNMLA